MKFFTKTFIGTTRKNNEDNSLIFTKNDVVFSIVCDGMGGHWGGEFASRIAIWIFKDNIEKIDFNFKLSKSQIEKNIEIIIDNIIYEMKKFAGNDAQKNDMGTTLNAVILDKKTNQGLCVNIGDSRAYKIYQGKIEQILYDQNVLNNYYLKTEKDLETKILTNPMSRALISSIGPKKKLKIIYEFFSLENLDYILQVSDGIYEFISEEQILKIVYNSAIELQKKPMFLIKKSMENKSDDNLTASIIEINAN